MKAEDERRKADLESKMKMSEEGLRTGCTSRSQMLLRPSSWRDEEKHEGNQRLNKQL